MLGANHGGSQQGVFTDQVGVLTNDFFVNLLDMGTEWKAANDAAELFEGRDRNSGDLKYSGTRNELVFGSNSVLRAYAEVYASADGHETVRQRLRSGLGQGDEPRPLRPGIIPAG